MVLREMRRVAKPGGFMSSRDIAAQHFFPEGDVGSIVTQALFRSTGLSGWYGPLSKLLSVLFSSSLTSPCSIKSPFHKKNMGLEASRRFNNAHKLHSKW
jgi:ubiquinone/menaquinone biosynthesis C-methylase UbiE